MPSLLVTESGRANAQFITDRYTVASVRDADGSAAIVHAGPDDCDVPPLLRGRVPAQDATTLATGDAGARAAWGVIN